MNSIILKRIFIIDNALMYFFILAYFLGIFINLKIIIANIFAIYIFLFLIYLNIKHLIGIIFLIKERNVYIQEWFYMAFALFVSILYIVQAIPIMIFIIERIEYVNDPKIRSLFGMVIFNIIMSSGLILSMLYCNRYIKNIKIKVYYNIIVPSVYFVFLFNNI